MAKKIAFFLLLSLPFCFHSVIGQKENQKHSQALFCVTAADGSSLLEYRPVILKSKVASEEITINPEIRYQEMDGFGYTLTGGSAYHLQHMSPDARRKILNELFGNGDGEIGVSYLRLSIGASDLDEKTWSYDDLPEGTKDPELLHFSMAYDTLYLIPTLREILEINPHIKLLGSPWSAPKWMKDNNDTRGGSLLPEYYDAYANYFCKYIEGMAGEGIRINAITPQNEPLHPGNNPSMFMPADQQAEFIKSHLGPVFKQKGIQTKIIVYDHNADKPDYPLSILSDPAASKYVDGSAFHLYGGKISTLSSVHDSFPLKNLYFTEQWVGAPGDFKTDFPWHLETLIIGASRNWCKTVLEWNLASDEKWQPHTDRGGCTSCLGAITISGDKITRNPAYYIVAQASEFVRPGSVRIESNLPTNIPNVAFTTPDGKTAVILMNKNDKSVNIRINCEGKSIVLPMNAGETGTLLW